MKGSLFYFLSSVSCLALMLLTQNSLAFLGNNAAFSNVQFKLSSNKILSHGIVMSSTKNSKSNVVGIIKNRCGIISFWKKIKVINPNSFRNEKSRKRIKFAFAAILTLFSRPRNIMAETYAPVIHKKSPHVIRKSPCTTMISSEVLSDSNKGKRIMIALSGGALVGALLGSDIKVLAKKRNKNEDKGEEVYQSLMNVPPPTTLDTEDLTKSTESIKAAIEESTVEAVKASEEKAFTMAANDLAKKWREEDEKIGAEALAKAEAEMKTEKNKIEAAKIEAEARIRAKLKAQKEEDEKKAADALAKANAEMKSDKIEAGKIEAEGRVKAKLKAQKEKGEYAVEASEISNEGTNLMKKAELSDKYAQLPLEERAFQILVDLGMVNITADPDDPNYDSSHDNEWAPENIFENFHFQEEKPSTFSRLRRFLS